MAARARTVIPAHPCIIKSWSYILWFQGRFGCVFGCVLRWLLVAYPLRGCTPGTRRRRHHREDDSHYAETVQEAHRCRRWTYWLVKIKDLNLSTRRYPRHLSNLYTLLATRCLSAPTTTSRCPSAPTTTSRCLSAPTTTTRCPSAPTATTRCPSAPTTTTRCESPPPVIC